MFALRTEDYGFASKPEVMCMPETEKLKPVAFLFNAIAFMG